MTINQAYQTHLRLKTMAEKLWRVEQLSTMGWALVDERAVRLTKAAAKLVLENAMSEGIKPSDLRAVPDKL